MHNKIITVLKKFFKINNAENINIDELKKETYHIEEHNEKTSIKSQQIINATYSQLKILKKLANASNVQLNQKRELQLL